MRVRSVMAHISAGPEFFGADFLALIVFFLVLGQANNSHNKTYAQGQN